MRARTCNLRAGLPNHKLIAREFDNAGIAADFRFFDRQRHSMAAFVRGAHRPLCGISNAVNG
jgi:hypothetical protein